jgi:primosomal protein N' (replication factor Y)
MVNAAAKDLADALRKHFGKRILGPEYPIVSRIRNLYHKNILIKLEREASAVTAKKIISDLLTQFKASSDYKSVRMQVDVDPV